MDLVKASEIFGCDLASLGVVYDQSLEEAFAELRDEYFSLIEGRLFDGNSLFGCLELLSESGILHFDGEFEDETEGFSGCAVSLRRHGWALRVIVSGDDLMVLAFPPRFSQDPASEIRSVHEDLHDDPDVIAHTVMES